MNWFSDERVIEDEIDIYTYQEDRFEFACVKLFQVPQPNPKFLNFMEAGNFSPSSARSHFS